ncbi:hypothetical protein BC628DRAFT_1422608 [Trametes gibbosa]|nr:hypothetical protein BC628DRAFT_1422608 [Trametes gibbosa]
MTDILSHESTTGTPASYPFNLDSADLILRTSDDVEFRVHRAILAIASPVFATMFRLPQPQDDLRKVLPPTLDLSEDSKTLDTLLRMCYPVAKKEDDDVDNIALILSVAMKYDMEWPISVLSKKLEGLASQEPLRVWAAASRLHCETIARKSAALLVAQKGAAGLYDILIIVNKQPAALEGVSAGDYFRLGEFLRQQGKVPDDYRMLSPPPTTEDDAADKPLADSNLQPSFACGVPQPDVICRSSDGVDFEAHRAILTSRSVVLQNTSPSTPNCPEMETREQSHSDSEGRGSSVPHPSDAATRMPILHFEGDAHTLSIILAICYGKPASDGRNLSRLAKVMATCRHYETDSVYQEAQRLWDEKTQSSPLDAYFTAVQHGLAPQARAAASLVRSRGSEPLKWSYSPLMEEATAVAFHRLANYRRSCECAVRDALAIIVQDWESDSVKKSGTKNRKNYSPPDIKLSHQALFLTYLSGMVSLPMEKYFGSGWQSSCGRPVTALLDPSLEDDLPDSVEHFLYRVIEAGKTLPHQIAAAIEKVQLEL